jgi:hypothetical protein
VAVLSRNVLVTVSCHRMLQIHPCSDGAAVHAAFFL